MGALVATAPEDLGRTVVTPVGAGKFPPPPVEVLVRVTMVVGVVVVLDVVVAGLPLPE